MLLLSLAWQSLRNRRVTTLLTVFSIALSVALLLGVEALRTSARESFSSTISGTDLIVGARGGSLQLLLSTVFRIGSVSNGISQKTYEEWAHHPGVLWTIPYSLGDSHKSFRVVGTDQNFYTHYRFRRTGQVVMAEGHPATGEHEAALGSDVAAQLHYALGTRITLTHGLGASGIMDHEEQPFTVVGILARTATPIDRAIYVSLGGIEHIHEDTPESTALTSFLVAAKSRRDTLFLQREINTYKPEPLTAIIPGVTLNELWSTVRFAEIALEIVGGFVVLVGLMGMLVAIYTTLNERRREMAILRALGAGPIKILSLFLLESLLLAGAGCALGVGMMIGSIALLQGIVENRFGLYLRWQGFEMQHAIYLAIVLGAALIAGLIPAWRAYRNTLADGLSVRI
ncbi:ABC transporter permease [Bryobacter aggregatus]|uniref:ABC transporter permease n=1 Tax=Bryobacter aggregatus TaxID=360054 RepID=UPI0004E1FA8D|nr:ABC transporter permease [Bryobacter aggregatus]